MTPTTESALELLLADGSDTSRMPRITKALEEMTWAITAPTLAVIQEVYVRRIAGQRFTDLELDERLADARHRGHEFEARIIPFAITEGPRAASGRGTGRRTTGQIAVLPLYGVMMARAGFMAQMSGGTGVEQVMSTFKALINDPDVSAILFDIDSPGGSTDLVAELGQLIFDARGEGKPIAAIANTDANSGALWVASQCDEFAVTPSGRAGSIGCYATFQDLSAQLEAEGVKTTLISYGKFKTELHPSQPLTPEATAAVQSIVDAYGQMFEGAVARGRGVSIEKVRSDFGQGRVLMAKQAVAAGLADRVATFDQMIDRLARGAVIGGKPGKAGIGATSPNAVRRQETLLELTATDLPIAAAADDDTCTTCDHAGDGHDGPDNQGACTVDGCDCTGMTVGPDDLEANSRLEALLAAATSSTIVAGDHEVVVLDLHGASASGADAGQLREHLARITDREVIILANGAKISVEEPPGSTSTDDELGDPAELTQARPPGRHNLHRRAVRTALRTAAQAAKEVETQ